MKKNILALSLLTLMSAGCSQEELIENNVNQQPTENKVFTATLGEEGDAQSRVYVEDQTLHWTANDQISIFVGNTVNAPYQFQGETGATEGSFLEQESTSTTTGNSLSNNYAVYPYNETTTISTEGVITTTLPATQTYAENSFGLGANTMAAVTNGTDDRNLSFKNVCGYLKLQLYGTNFTVQTITLSGNNNEKIAGKATVTFGNDGLPAVTMANDATTTITLNCGDNGVTISTDANAPTAFYMVVPPTTFTEGLTVTVTATDGTSFTQSTSNEITINRGKVRPMNALEKNLGEGTLELPRGYTFSTTIEPILEESPTLTQIKFIANSSTTSEKKLVTDEDGTIAYIKTNENSLEIHTIGRKFIADEDLYCMFEGMSQLTTIDFGDNFDTSNVTDMGSIFSQCSNLTSLDLSKFNTTNVTKMSAMFNGCSKLTSLDITMFNTTNVTNLANMFKGCSGLTSLDVTKFNTENVTSMHSMFSGCTGLNSLNISNFNTSKVTEMERLFENCSGLSTLDLGNFNTSSATNMISMFSGCSNLTTLDVSNFNTPNLYSMDYMFKDCSKLSTLNVSMLDTQNVTSMSGLFAGCSNLSSLILTSSDVTKFNTSKVRNMSFMFYNCSKLENLNVSNFNTAEVKDINNMFINCSGLTSLDVKNFDTSNVTNMSSMFFGCTGLPSLDLTSFTFKEDPKVNVKDMLLFTYNTSFSIPVKTTEAGHTYLTVTTSNCNLPTNCKFVRPDGTDW